MIGLAWLAPDWGASDGWLKGAVTRRIAVFVIFLVQGLGLPTEALTRGAVQWRLHGFVLGWNYVAVPVLVLAALAGLGGWVSPELRFGFVYLAILPTTITSAVYFTSAAKGDVGAAVFSTAISNLLSVVLVPLGCAWFLFRGGSGEVSVAQMLLKLCQLIVLPMVLGQVMRPWLITLLPRLKSAFKRATTVAIFFIMYSTFCDGVKRAAWDAIGWGSVLGAGTGALTLLVVVAWGVWFTSAIVGLDPGARVSAFFCASQKSLATGVPMATSIFASGVPADSVPDVSVIVVPLMIYHFLQLTLAARLVPRLLRDDRSSGGL